jgi:hypothetical protein
MLLIDVDPEFSPSENSVWKLLDRFNFITMGASRSIPSFGLACDFGRVLREFNRWAPEHLQLSVPTIR